MSFELFLSLRVADAIDACTAELASAGASATARVVCAVRLNRGVAYAQLSMREHAARDCVAVYSVESDDTAVHVLRARARVLHASLHSVPERAVALLCDALCDATGDFALGLEIVSRLKALGHSVTFPLRAKRVTESSPPAAAAAAPPPSPPAAASSPPPVAATAESVSESSIRAQLESDAPLSETAEQAAAKIVVERGLVQHAVGDKDADATIARGYLQVNTGKLSDAVTTFSGLLLRKPFAVAAYLGRGTAYALGGSLADAEIDFTTATRMSPELADGYKRRAQVRAALDRVDEALVDLARAQRLAPDDWEPLQHSGALMMKKMNHAGAAQIFDDVVRLADAAIASSRSSPAGSVGEQRRKLAETAKRQAQHHAAVCVSVIGQVERGERLFVECLSDSPNADTLSALATTYREAGRADDAIACLDESLALLEKGGAGGDKLAFVLHLRGQLRFQRGLHRAALRDMLRAVACDRNSIEAANMCGVLLQGLGRYGEALKYFNGVHERAPAHVAYYNRAFALLQQSVLDVPLADVCFDRALTPLFKESWCKRRDAAAHLGKEYRRAPDAPAAAPADVADNGALEGVADAPRIKLLLEYADRLGQRMQYDSPGFISNERQQRVFGFGMLAISQQLRALFRAERSEPVPAARSSAASDAHAFGWRDLYDMGVRWRQIAEPNDPVFWVDQLTPEQFAEGFGSHTPMVTKQTHVVRYSPFLQRATDIVRALLLECGGAGLTASERGAIAAARDYKELVSAVGRDFWVVTRCESRARPGAVIEGTRLTMQLLDAQIGTYEVSIRTPGTPHRWSQFDVEMSHHFAELCRAARCNETAAAVQAAHRLAFYWYNFMPLSRGTAASGLCVLHAMLLAVGVERRAPVPSRMQVDWEAILRPSPEDFVASLRDWFVNDAPASDALLNLPAVSDVLPTLRHLLTAVNADLNYFIR
jgi:tetratricopeptide (TPR) repeat protein